MRSKLTYLIYLTSIVGLFLIIIEVLLGQALNNPDRCPAWLYERTRLFYLEYDRNIIQYDTTLAQYDSALFYTLKPGTNVFSNREFSTIISVNKLGCRDDIESLKTPQIVAIGDSYCMGWGVQQNKSYPELLEDLLRKKVLNLGISSYALPRELKLLERVDLDSLKWLLVQHHYNDEYELLNRADKGHIQISSEDKYDSLCNVLEKNRKYFPMKYTTMIGSASQKGSSAILDIEALAMLREKYSVHKEFLKGLSRIVEDQAEIQMIVFTLGEKGFSNDFMQNVRLLLKTTGGPLESKIHFLDFSKAFGPAHYYPWDGHLNEFGHKVVAETIAAYLMEQDAVP